jgi:dihydroorotate dehydrogenase
MMTHKNSAYPLRPTHQAKAVHPSLLAAWKTLRPWLFRVDAERAHHVAMSLLKGWGGCGLERLICVPECVLLERSIAGLKFRNPVGLAAGFDKNGECLDAWQALGFGFVEVGTVTASPQPGNPKPRLFRIPSEGALFNRLGFNNEGSAKVARRIERWRAKQAKRAKGTTSQMVLGVNIGKSRQVELADAPQDYGTSFRDVRDVADYIVVNVSSPNTPNLRRLQDSDHLKALFDVLCSQQSNVPIFLKLSPDLTEDSAFEAGHVAIDYGLKGLIASNTTIDISGLGAEFNEARQGGGLSGKPLFARSTSLLKQLRAHFGSHLHLVGVGGIMSLEDAKAKFDAGADLVQVYTGFVYGGPTFVADVLQGLDKS